MTALTATTAPIALPLGTLARVLRRLQGWWLVRRTERELAELSPRQLADIGLDAPRLPRRHREAMLNGTLLA